IEGRRIRRAHSRGHPARGELSQRRAPIARPQDVLHALLFDDGPARNPRHRGNGRARLGRRSMPARTLFGGVARSGRARRALLAPRRRDLDLPLAAPLPHQMSTVMKHSSAAIHCLFAWIALLALTALSWGLSYAHLGSIETTVALLIACAKATVVI